MASNEYWEKRFVQLEDAQTNKGIEYFHELEKQYSKAARNVEKELASWYGRLAVNNEISMAEAKKMLTTNELKEFRWTVEDYIKAGRENAIDGRWVKQLENASARVHISRLEAMKVQMQQQIEMLYGNEYDSMNEFMKGIFTDSYYRTAFEIQKGFGVGYDLMKLDPKRVERVISKPWAADGSNFSSRIWKQKNQLVSDLQNGLTQAAITGSTPEALTKYVKSRFEVSTGQAGRLVMTETSFFHSAGQKEMFNDLGVEEYEICATLDNKTSEICRDLDGKVLKMSEFQPGVTAPPFHCWCRTTTVPYFNDEFTIDETRAARDEETGKTYYVPSDMKYRDWKDSFVDGGSKDGLDVVNATKNDTLKIESTISFVKQEDADSLNEYINRLDGKEKENWINSFNETDYEIISNEPDYISHYNPNDGKVYFNSYDNSDIAFHETAHAIDNGSIDIDFNVGSEKHPYMIQFDTPSAVLDAMDSTKTESDFRKLCDKLGVSVNVDGDWFNEGEDVFGAFNKFAKNITSQFGETGFDAFSDIVSAMTLDYTGGSLLWGGHSNSYWMQTVPGSTLVSKEIWANYCFLRATKNSNMLDLLKEISPNRYDLLEFLYKEVFLK